MKHKSVLVLSVLTLVALAVAAVAVRSRDSGSTLERARLFPGLDEGVNEVTEIVVEKGGKKATLKRDGGQWKLADRGGYPAKFDAVKQIAVRVAGLEIEEHKTAKKENHGKLEVEWPASGEESEAALVRLLADGGKELAALVVGKSEWTGSKPKVYVRRAGEDQVYLVSGPLEASPEPQSWIETKFVELKNERVQSVTIEHADGERVEIARSAADHTQFAVQNLPPGETERHAGVANGVAQVLGYGLALEDVRPVGEIDFTKEPVALTRFRCVDGLEVLVESAKFEDKTWVKITTGYVAPPEPAPAETPADAAPAEGEAPPAEEPEAKPDVGQEATDLGAKLAPWAFAIPSYKSDYLGRRMKDLIPAPPTGGGTDDGGLDALMENFGMDEGAPGEEGADHAHPEVVEPEPAPDDEEKAPEGGPPKPE